MPATLTGGPWAATGGFWGFGEHCQRREPLTSDGGADVDPWLGHPQPADLQRAHGSVKGDAARALTRQPLGGEPAYPAADEEALHQHDEDSAQDEHRDDRLHEGVGYEQQHQQDEQPIHVELAEPAPGIHVVAREGLDRPAIPDRKRPVLAPAKPLHPASTVIALAVPRDPAGLFAVLRRAIRLAAAALGVAALGGGLAFTRGDSR